MFVEVVFIEERERAEALSDALLDTGALSAAIEDADAGSIGEQPLYGEPGSAMETRAWERSRVVALFDHGSDIEAMVQEALAAIGVSAAIPFSRRDVPDENWVELTQSQFEPIPVGERLWIVPSWHEPPAAAKSADAIVLRLDPGMAFGTGDHPTTRLCLAWLERHVVAGDDLIDYGCGSGILAIAAKKLGAGTVTGIDIDDQAVSAARVNAVANDVAVAFANALPPSSDVARVPRRIVVANILSNPLKVLAPLLTSLVAPDGRLVLSGILERQWRDVAAAYAPSIVLDVWRVEDGWVCLVGTRKGH